MGKNQRILVNFILDASGSMSSCLESTISGFNEYVSSLKKNNEAEVDFSLTLFNSELDMKFTNRPIHAVESLSTENYRPNGNTALYDAVCESAMRMVKQGTIADKVLFVIMTDGEENSSKNYNLDNLKGIIKLLESTGEVTFVYLGANQDSWKNAKAFGLSMNNVTNYKQNPKSITRSFNTLAVNTVMLAKSASGSTASYFSEQDKNHINEA
jgi:uncharacterized protein YegL